MTLPLLVTTPHSSGHAPYDVLAAMLGPEVADREARERRLAHLFQHGDPYTDALFHLPGARHLHATTSRFVVDLNRDRDEGGPNGVVKLTDFDERPLYPDGFVLEPQETEERLARYWDPFHEALDRALARPDVLGFLDGHSMSPLGPPIGPDGGARRPALNLITGGDRDGEPRPDGGPVSLPGPVARALAARAEERFGELVAATPGVPHEVWINAPFVVGGIQRRYGDPRRRAGRPGLSLEFNRALFLEPGPDDLDVPIPGRVEALNARLRELAEDLVALLRADGGS